jgi:GH24 family phage-related lysozyme (muramidase)
LSTSQRAALSGGHSAAADQVLWWNWNANSHVRITSWYNCRVTTTQLQSHTHLATSFS